MDASRESEAGHITDEPVKDRFEKNKSQLVRKGSRIVIKAKERVLNSHHEKMKAIKQRMSEGSTNLDSESNIEIAAPPEIAPTKQKLRYKI